MASNYSSVWMQLNVVTCSRAPSLAEDMDRCAQFVTRKSDLLRSLERKSSSWRHPDRMQSGIPLKSPWRIIHDSEMRHETSCGEVSKKIRKRVGDRRAKEKFNFGSYFMSGDAGRTRASVLSHKPLPRKPKLHRFIFINSLFNTIFSQLRKTKWEKSPSTEGSPLAHCACIVVVRRNLKFTRNEELWDVEDKHPTEDGKNPFFASLVWYQPTIGCSCSMQSNF